MTAMPTDGDDNDPKDAPDDLRARDLVESRSPALDPETVAKLASWFDLPSYDQVEEREAAARAADREAERETASQKVQKRRAEALANIDPGFLGRLDHRRARGADLRHIAPQEILWERRLLAIDEDRIPPVLSEEDYPEVVVPQALVKDVKTCTPQAFLRDLHRPEKDFWIRLQPAFEDAGEPEAPDPMGPIRETLRTDYRLAVVPPAVTTIASGIADLREILARPWAEAKRERARKREAELLGKEAAEGGVPRLPEGAS